MSAYSSLCTIYAPRLKDNLALVEFVHLSSKTLSALDHELSLPAENPKKQADSYSVNGTTDVFLMRQEDFE